VHLVHRFLDFAAAVLAVVPEARRCAPANSTFASLVVVASASAVLSVEQKEESHLPVVLAEFKAYLRGHALLTIIGEPQIIGVLVHVTSNEPKPCLGSKRTRLGLES
jgi:hypothetical protein